MEAEPAHDAAFGPMGDAPGVSTAPSVSPIGELQTLLNMRGFGPLVINGQLDDATKRAMRNAQLPDDITQALELLRAPAVTGAAPTMPWYKQPKYLLGVAAVLSVVGYVAYRAGFFEEENEASSAEEGSTDDFNGLSGVKPAKTPKRSKPKKEKCGVIPSMDGAEELEPPEES